MSLVPEKEGVGFEEPSARGRKNPHKLKGREGEPDPEKHLYGIPGDGSHHGTERGQGVLSEKTAISSGKKVSDKRKNAASLRKWVALKGRSAVKRRPPSRRGARSSQEGRSRRRGPNTGEREKLSKSYFLKGKIGGPSILERGSEKGGKRRRKRGIILPREKEERKSST